MGSFVEAGKTDEFNSGTMKEVEVQGNKVLLARVGDKYFAASGRCPHMGGTLAHGKLDGTVVTCPLHGSQFDLSDGHVVRWLKGAGVLSSIGKAIKGQQPLTVYNVKIVGRSILVEL